MATVPLRNLSPMAEPWGRSVDERLDGLDSRLDFLDSGSTNSGRMANSGLDNVASQVAELFARQTAQATGSNMDTATFGPLASPPDVVQTIQLPTPPDDNRIGWLAVQCAVSFSGPDDAYSNGFLTYELDGELIGAFGYALPFVGASFEFASGYSVSYSSLIAGPNLGGSLRITLGGRGLATAGTRQIFATNIRATVQYGQRVV